MEEELQEQQENASQDDLQAQRLQQALEALQEQNGTKKKKNSRGFLITFLIILLIFVGIVDLALASYIGLCYLSPRTTVATSSESQSQTPQ